MTQRPPRHTLALFAALGTTFDLVHDALDHWGQPSWAAKHKRTYGSHLVYRDGTPVGPGNCRPEGRTSTATQLGRRACTQHVATYTAGQLAAVIAVTRACGYRIPLHAALLGAAINATTHWALDRGELLRYLADAARQTEYLKAMTVVRAPGGDADQHGAGTAWNELDRSAHRVIGLIASVVMTRLCRRG